MKLRSKTPKVKFIVAVDISQLQNSINNWLAVHGENIDIEFITNHASILGVGIWYKEIKEVPLEEYLEENKMDKIPNKLSDRDLFKFRATSPPSVSSQDDKD